MISKEYKEWVKQSGLDPLTNTEHKFAEFLLANKEELKKVGDLTKIYLSVSKYLKK